MHIKVSKTNVYRDVYLERSHELMLMTNRWIICDHCGMCETFKKIISVKNLLNPTLSNRIRKQLFKYGGLYIFFFSFMYIYINI